jgi:hypothetical protein
MLWQHCRRSLLRRSLKLHRAVGKPLVLEDLFRDERGYRQPRIKARHRGAAASPALPRQKS